MKQAESLSLTVKRRIRADAAELFRAWTDPARLRTWWGPGAVRCSEAEMDLRPGGRYRIGNLMPDGKIIWIGGEFEVVEPPHTLVYTWCVDPGSGAVERVTVRFEEHGAETEVTVIHERIADASTRERHQAGWQGCLDKLQAHLAGP